MINMKRQNCWESKKCGRQLGGEKTKELGVCPASTEAKVTGVNGGSFAGRCCWAVAGTLCGGKVQGTFASKLANCISCEFYLSVKKEEGKDIKSISAIMSLLHS
jgi:hypothetical protein